MTFPYHGLPDWGLTGRKATVYGLDDLGEAVARLGSPVVWDRRGDVFWIETFEYGRRKASVSGDPVGYTNTLSSALAEHGPYCMVIGPATGLGAYVDVRWFHPLPPYGGWGHEVWWSGYDILGTVAFSMAYTTGTKSLVARAVYNVPQEKLYILGPRGELHLIAADVSLLMDLSCHHIIKVVADFDMGYYKRVILDRETFECEDIELCSQDNTDKPALLHWVNITKDTESICKMTIDTLILTQNEP